MLEAKNVTLRFGGLVANNDVSMKIRDGQITGLIGPNGAGKTTFFDCLCGVYTPNEGSVELDGVNIVGKRPHVIHDMGVSRTYQVINLFRDMTVLENVLIGMHGALSSNFFQSTLHVKKEREEEAAAREKGMELLKFVNLEDKASMKAGALSYGEQRRLEIVRGLAIDPKVILLDEPAAGMNPTEKNELDVLLKKIIERGVSILMVEHDMNMVMGVCDYIYVLYFGKLLAEGTPEEIQKNPQVIEAYLGGDE